MLNNSDDIEVEIFISYGTQGMGIPLDKVPVLIEKLQAIQGAAMAQLEKGQIKLTGGTDV